MTLAEFCRRIGVDYNVMRRRLRDNRDLFFPISQVKRELKDDRLYKGDTMEELVELYRGFAGDENELQMIADFACTDRKHAIRILRQIKKCLEQKEGIR